VDVLRYVKLRLLSVHNCVVLKHGLSGSVSCAHSHILGFRGEELLSRPVIRKELQEQLSQQMSFLHLLHWCVLTCIMASSVDDVIGHYFLETPASYI